MPPPITRRRFLAASAGAAGAAPFVKAVAPGEPKDKVRLAVIGLANRGAANLKGVEAEEVVALCDVDPAHAGKARAQFPNAEFFTDYRALFDSPVIKRVDGVVVSTPDHTHALPTVAALRLGKAVYCEKPLARTVDEVRAVRKAAAGTKAVTQMGTQVHAGENYRRAVEIVRAGALGDVARVYVWVSHKPTPGKRVPPAAGPKFDLDVWVGPVADPFFGADHPAWPHFHWRYWWEFGGGTLGDFGCHFLDLPFWALGLGLPTEVASAGSRLPGADTPVPGTQRVDYTFPGRDGKPAVRLTWQHGVPGPDLDDAGPATFPGFPTGVLFVGAKGRLVADYTKLRLLPDEFAGDFKASGPAIPKSVGHHKEWLDAIRGTGAPLCEFGYAGVLTEAVLLGNVALRAAPGQRLAYDAEAGRFPGLPAADRYLGQPARKGWELG